MEKRGTDSQTTNNNIIRSKRFAYRTPNVTNTHSEHVTLGILLFHCNNDCTNMPQCYVIRTLAVLFKLLFHESNETLSAVMIILPIWLQGRKTVQHVSVAQDINHIRVSFTWRALHERTWPATEFLAAKWVAHIQERLKFPERRRCDTNICFIIFFQSDYARSCINPLNAKLNPICCLLALLGAHCFLHVSRIRVKSLTLRLLMSYIYGAPILDVSRSHTTTQHSR